MNYANAGSEVIIASSSLDSTSTTPVAQKLVEQHGLSVITYEADKVADGSIALEIAIDQVSGLTIAYDNRTLNTVGCAAAWYRRPNEYPLQTDRLRQHGLEAEYREQQRAIWADIPERAWLNSPVNIRRAEEKMGQLVTAANVGFTIPQTVVSNRWESIKRVRSDKLAVKTASGAEQYSHGRERIIFTQSFPNNGEALPLSVLPYPAIWQPHIPKAREWRVTVIGDDVFSATIYTSEDAKTDWRRHQISSEVTFQKDDFPLEEQSRCIALLGHYGIRFGAFDFIETPEGELIFLEVNPNGQFMWLEQDLGLPISGAIASELARIAHLKS